MTDTGLTTKTLLALRWSAAAKFSVQLITWGMTIFVVRLLQPSDYGLMAMAMVFVGFLNMLNEAGLGAAIIQKKILDEETLRQIFGFVLVVSFCLFLLLFVSSPLISRFFNEDRLTPIIRVLSLQFVIVSFGVIPGSLLERNLDIKMWSVADVAARVIGGGVTLFLAVLGWGVWALVCGSLLIYVVQATVLNIVSPFLRLPSFSLRGMRKIISFGGLVTVERLLWSLYCQADLLIIGRLLGKGVLGVYSVATDIASLPMQRINAVINQVGFPAFSRLQTDRQAVAFYLMRAVHFVSVFAFPVFWGISCVAHDVVDVLLGDTWAVAALPLQIVSLVMPLRMVTNLVPLIIKGLGRPEISVINWVVTLLVMSTAFLVGANWGLLGVSLAWAAFVVVFFLILRYSLPLLNLQVLPILRAMGRPALAGACMYAAVSIFKMLSFPDQSNVAVLIMEVIFGAAIYVGTLLSLDRKIYSEVLVLIRARPSV